MPTFIHAMGCPHRAANESSGGPSAGLARPAGKSILIARMLMEKVAILTGAASGIGLDLARQLLQSGWKLAALDRNETGLQQALGQASGTDRLLLLTLDVSKASDWELAWERCTEQLGAPGLLINNAAIIAPGRIAAADAQTIDRHVDINLKGVMYGTSLAARRMIQAGTRGHIINIASMAGLAPVPGIGVYSATKFGVRAYSLVAAQELKEHGIAVTNVCPDLVDTPMLDAQIPYEEAAITFSGPGAMPASRISRAVLQAIQTRPLEVVVPAHRGWLAKIASFFPGLMGPLKARMERKGRKRAEAYRQTRRTAS
jgi:NAD(P)-dependent dehydrogenase (short-subunit alcohol dehydrogenase family)